MIHTRRAFLGSLAAGLAPAKGGQRLNVLLITVDDLRPQLGCYGDRVVHTPHIDSLAKRGVVFQRAYAQQALCSPSRTSLLTGLRPDTTRIYDIETHFRDRVSDAVTLPQLFKNNGYAARGFYKVFHLAGFDPSIGNLNDEASWSVPLYLPRRSVYGPEGEKVLRASYARLRAEGKQIGYQHIPRSFAYEAPDVGDDDISDGEVAAEAVKALREWRDRPFFIATGFYKPHLPFVAPRKYWDLYRRDRLPLPDNQFAPAGAPPYAVPSDRELRTYVGIPEEGEFPEELKRTLLHGYLASVSYVDAQVGRLLAELRTLGLLDKTMIVLLGDHGYMMGEHGTWAKKHSNFEIATRSPLIVSAPGMAASAQTNALVEFVDIYPTLAELAGLRAPATLEGRSFVPLLNDPQTPWKPAAYSQHPGGGRMGRSVTDGHFRYTEWARTGEAPDGIELYDHAVDPGENRNRAGDPALGGDEVRLQRLLRAGFKDLKPREAKS